MVRPSVRSTHMVSSSKRRRSAEVLIPTLFDQRPILEHDLLQFSQPPAVEARAVSQGDIRLKPELGFVPILFDVDMERLARLPLVRLEEKPEALIPQDHRH